MQVSRRFSLQAQKPSLAPSRQLASQPASSLLTCFSLSPARLHPFPTPPQWADARASALSAALAFFCNVVVFARGRDVPAWVALLRVGLAASSRAAAAFLHAMGGSHAAATRGGGGGRRGASGGGGFADEGAADFAEGGEGRGEEEEEAARGRSLRSAAALARRGRRRRPAAAASQPYAHAEAHEWLPRLLLEHDDDAVRAGFASLVAVAVQVRCRAVCCDPRGLCA